MKFICSTCGGECNIIGTAQGAVRYRCAWCGNEYVVKEGGTPPYNPYPKTVKKDNSPRTMPQPTQNKNVLTGDEIYERNINSVIELRTVMGSKIKSGSGYAVGSGLAITNAHVVTNDGKILSGIRAYACGNTYAAEVVKLSEKDDLALIKISGAPAEMKGVRFADVTKLKNGQRLYVLGNSMGGGTCITGGVVSDRRRTVLGKPRLMTDCAVNKGNSGGPAFTDSGEVAGTITEVTSEAEGMNYAIPSDVVLNFLADCGVKI